MLDQLFELSRKAAESSLQTPQAIFKHLTQDWASTSPISTGLSADWAGSTQKRCADLGIQALNKHRESIDSAYRAGIETIGKLVRVPEIKSSEDSVRAAEELCRSVFEAIKEQSDAQFHEFQSWVERLLEMARKSSP
jgi:hypothetical protein